MGTTLCKYHPRVPARWFCSDCSINVCSSCAKVEYLPEEVRTCSVCKGYLNPLGMENVITPFWKRLPRFFLYPLNLTALGLMTGLMVLSALLFTPSLIGVLLQLALFLMFLRYAYAVLLHTALGHLTPPPLSHETLIDGMELPFKQLFVFIATGMIAGIVGSAFGDFAGNAVELMFLLAMPATVMVIAIDKSFWRALNPAVLFGIMRHVGWPYLLLYFFLLLLWGGSGAAVSVFYGVVPDLMFVALYAFASMYFMLIMFNMMGYVIYQYHERLGFEVEVDYEAGDEAAVARPGAAANDAPEVRILIAEGKTAEATALLQDRLRAEPSHALHEQLHKLLTLTGAREDMLQHGREWLAQLITDKRFKQALDVVRDCLPLDRDFRPGDPQQIYPLASFAQQTNDAKLAVHLLNGFANRHPDHPDIPRAYFLAAKLLCESLKQDARAKQLLENLLRRYPQHELAPAIKSYLGMINRLGAQPGAR